MNKESLNKKWGVTALSQGWVALPTKLIFLQSELEITPMGMNIILNLVAHWWDPDKDPYPSQEMIAKKMGVSKRSIQREINKLIEAELIEKIPSNRKDPKYSGRNRYKLEKLVKRLNGIEINEHNKIRG